MKCLSWFNLGLAALLGSSFAAPAEVKVLVEHNDNERASAAFKLKTLPGPIKEDAAAPATFSLVEGQRDPNGGGLEKLHDGRAPTEEDQPEENFFLSPATDEGRILVDLGRDVEVRHVCTYSWHPGPRGPQVYRLYGSLGKAADFNARPGRGTDPEQRGWKCLAKVDTRSKEDEGGGQYGVDISDSSGPLGNYRYLLFLVERTENRDPFGNTFFSEIDVLDTDLPKGTAVPTETVVAPFVTNSSDGYCQITIDSSKAPELKEWAEQKLAPVLAEWYPKLTRLMASDGYAPPKRFSITLKPDPNNGVAATGGTRITANSNWLKRELNREAIGALLHEEIHVVQQYNGGRRSSTGERRSRPPGWLVEGIPDYIRWFLYEPQSHGADLQWLRSRRNTTLRYDGLYRISANFLNYAVTRFGDNLITKLNAACRQGTYNDELWKTWTGKTLEEINDDWKTETEKQLAK